MARIAFKPKYMESSGPPKVEPLLPSKDVLKRRQRRAIRKERSMICFGCRAKGHSISTCPKEASSNICYRCKSKEHSLSKCPIPLDPDNPTPFASCFVCSESGHLSKDCPKNENGLYPFGGGCKFCGSVRHLAQHCKRSSIGNGNDVGVKTIGKINLEQGADDDDVFIALENIQSSSPKLEKKKKVILF